MFNIKKMLSRFFAICIFSISSNLAHAEIIQFNNLDQNTAMFGTYLWKSDYVYDGMVNYREEFPSGTFIINFSSVGTDFKMSFDGPGCGNEKTCSGFYGSTRDDQFYNVGVSVNRIGTYYGDFKYIQLWNVNLSRFYLPLEGYSLVAPTLLATSNQVVAFISGVPEPATDAMFLAGLGILGYAARRKQA